MCELNGTKCIETIVCVWCATTYNKVPETQTCITCNASGHWANIDSPVGMMALTLKKVSVK